MTISIQRMLLTVAMALSAVGCGKKRGPVVVTVGPGLSEERFFEINEDVEWVEEDPEPTADIFSYYGSFDTMVVVTPVGAPLVTLTRFAPTRDGDTGYAKLASQRGRVTEVWLSFQNDVFVWENGTISRLVSQLERAGFVPMPDERPPSEMGEAADKRWREGVPEDVDREERYVPNGAFHLSHPSGTRIVLVMAMRVPRMGPQHNFLIDIHVEHPDHQVIYPGMTEPLRKSRREDLGPEWQKPRRGGP